MRWENGDKYVQIEGGFSVDVHENVWTIKSNVAWDDLPITLRRQVLKSDERAFDRIFQRTGLAI